MTPLNETPGAITRLTINVGPRTAAAINYIVATRNVNITEAVRLLVAQGFATIHVGDAARTAEIYVELGDLERREEKISGHRRDDRKADSN